MDGKRWKRVKRERWKGNSEDRELGQSEGGRESGERENKEGMRKGEDSEAEMSTLGAKSKGNATKTHTELLLQNSPPQ